MWSISTDSKISLVTLWVTVVDPYHWSIRIIIINKIMVSAFDLLGLHNHGNNKVSSF